MAPRRGAKEKGLLAGYDNTYLLCRDVRHAWSVEGYWRDGTAVRRKLHCLRCSTTRTDVWTAKGGRLRNQYQHPDGYSVKGGLNQQAVREEELRRVRVFDNEAALMESLFET